MSAEANCATCCGPVRGRARLAGEHRSPFVVRTKAASVARPLNGNTSRRAGVVLLEVIIALALFAAAAAVISGSFRACASSVDRLRIQAVADDLAVSLLSEMQLGLIEPVDDGPYDYGEPYEDWSWEIVTSDLNDVIDTEGPLMMRVEIVIRHADGNCTRRLRYLVPATLEPEDEPADEPADEGPVDMGGQAP